MSLVNLLPEDYIARQRQKRANLLCAGLFAVVVLAVVAATAVSEQGYRHTREVSRRVDEAYRQAGQLIGQLQGLEVTRDKMLRKAGMTAALLERVPRSYLLAVITNALPEGASLTKLEMTSRRQTTLVVKKDTRTPQQAAAAAEQMMGESPSGLKIAITLTGLAGTDVEVARFIAAMARCPLMDRVDLVYSQEKKVATRRPDKSVVEHLAREFQVVMELRPDADVRGLASSEAAPGGKHRAGLLAPGALP